MHQLRVLLLYLLSILNCMQSNLYLSGVVVEHIPARHEHYLGFLRVALLQWERVLPRHHGGHCPHPLVPSERCHVQHTARYLNIQCRRFSMNVEPIMIRMRSHTRYLQQTIDVCILMGHGGDDFISGHESR